MTPMLMMWRRKMFEDPEVPVVDNDTDVDDVEYEDDGGSWSFRWSIMTSMLMKWKMMMVKIYF